MAGRYDTDIKLDENWQLTASSTGDAPVCRDGDCFIQDIQLEAISMTGELFYDSEWGWGLVEFLQQEDDEFTRLEITERVKEKLARRSEIDPGTISVGIEFVDEVIRLYAAFRFVDDDELQTVAVETSRVNVEVVLID